MHLNYIGNGIATICWPATCIALFICNFKCVPKVARRRDLHDKIGETLIFFIPFAGNMLLQVTVKILKNKAKDKNSLKAGNYKQQLWSEYVILGTGCISEASSSFQGLDGFTFFFAES